MPGLPLSESVESYLSRPQIPAAQEDLTFYDPDARSFYGDDDQDQPPAETMDSNRHSLATDQALRYLGLDEYYEQLSSPASGTSHETDRRLSTEFTLESTRAELRKTNTERQQNAIPFDRIPLSSNTITTHTTESLRPRRQQQNQMLFDRIPLAAHSLIPAGPERNYNQPLSERDEIAERAQRLRPARPAHTASDPYGDIYYTPPEQAQQVSRCVMTEQIRELRRRNDMAVLGATRPGNSSRDNMVASSSARSSAQSRHCADGSSSCSWHDTPARSGPPREIDMGVS